MYRYSEAEHLNFKLRLHGYEVPFMGGKVTSGINMPATANLQLIPTKWAKMIRPGTIAQVFYKDHFSSIITGKDIYRLLFEGDVRSKTYQRTEGGKAITLNCVDFSNYWLLAKFYFINFASGGLLGAANKMSFNGITKPIGNLLGTTGTIARAFQGKKKRFDQVVKEVLTSITDINEFFKDATERLKLSDRILSQSSKQMTSEVFNHQVFLKVIENNLSRSSGVEPLWKTITILLQMVFHELVCIAAPSFVEVRKFDEFKEDRASRMYLTEKEIIDSSIDWKRQLAENSTGYSYGPGQFIIKPNAWMLEPPACNMIYPNEVLNMSYVWDWQRRITRLQLVPTNPLFRSSGKGGDGFGELISTYAPNELQQFMKTLIAKKEADKTNRYATFLTDEEVERGIVPGYMTIIPGATSFLLSRFNKAEKTQIYNFVDQLADFEFERQKAAANSFSAQMVFKPHIAPGFPSVFIDDSELTFDVMALPTIVSHDFTSNGNGRTSGDFTLARELNEYRPGIDRDYPPNLQGLSIYQIPEEPPIPAWFDDSYTHGRIGSHVYGRILGCGGLLNAEAGRKDEVELSFPRKSANYPDSNRVITDPAWDKKHAIEVRSRLEGAVNSLRKEYRNAAAAGQGGYHVWKKTFRPIITEEQLFDANYGGKLYGSRSWFSKEQKTYVSADIFTKGLSRTSSGTIRTEQEINSPNSNQNTRPSTLSGANLAKVQSVLAKGQNKSSGASDIAKANLNTKQIKTIQDGGVVKPQEKVDQPGQKEKKSKTVNQPVVVTGELFYNTALSYTKGKRYIWGTHGPNSFDCSGVVYGTALLFGFKYPDLRRFSYDMYRFSCVRIPPELALKIKGAVLFNFRTVTKKEKGKVIESIKGHVGLAAGDGITTLEGLNPSDGVQTLRRRAKAKAWSNAGLLIGVKYEGAPIELPKSGIGFKTIDPSALINSTLQQHKISLIQLNRIEIIKRYQEEIFDTNAFLG